jgi:cytoskeleton protein RodZ
MSDGAAATDPAPSAGRLLREARERQGLHIAALAAAIKVAPKKLELLEADRFDALPDATFTRALAQTVCRALKIDSAAILKLLPPPLGHRLEHVGMGLNAPFRERPGALVQRDGSNLTLSPVFWVSALFLIAAVALYFAPSGLFGLPHWRGQAAASAAASGSPGEAAVASQAAASAGMGDASVTQLAALPGAADSALPAADPAAPTLAPALSPAAPGVIQLHATAPSWIEVTDGNGRSLVARVVQPGETIDLEGPAPFRVRIGNAAGTRVSFRGQPMELAAYTRDNVARLELK